MKIIFKNKRFRIFVSVYIFLWLLTAVWGNYDVRKKFNIQYGYAYKEWTNEKIKTEEVSSFYVYDLEHEYNKDKIPENGRFRYKSIGIAIAPFIIVDNIAAVWASLAGIGATRINLWVFGYTWGSPVIVYWCA